MPANAVYKESFPTGMPIPQAPKSPKPKILSPSVTHTARTSSSGLEKLLLIQNPNKLKFEIKFFFNRLPILNDVETMSFVVDCDEKTSGSAVN